MPGKLSDVREVPRIGMEDRAAWRLAASINDQLTIDQLNQLIKETEAEKAARTWIRTDPSSG